MTVHLVVNPTSGGGRAGKQLPQVVSALRETFTGRTLIVQAASSFDDARSLITAAAGSHRPDDVLIVMGGDGMMHLGVNAVAGTDLALGMIPAGSGNDLCRALSYPIKDLSAVLALLGGDPRPMDAMRVTPVDGGPPTWVGTIVASGFDARVNLRANAMRFPRGAVQYPVALMAELLRFAPIHYDLVIDGERRELDAMLVAIGNTTTYGGGIAMCPDADPDDGLLDLTIIHPVPRRILLRVFREIYSGTFTRLPQIEQVRARQVTLNGRLADGRKMTAMGDGEPIGDVPRVVELVPGAVRVYRPA